MYRSFARLAAFAVRSTCALAMLSAPTFAQNGAEKAAADTLFSEGKKLIAAGDTETACAKFEASLAKMRQLGAQLALASCYEKLGKTASAWGEFRAAASAAAKARDGQRRRFAEEHAAELEAKLSRLVIKVEAGYRIDGLMVKRNGLELEHAELGVPVPVDPGDYTVEAEAPGWKEWSTNVTVSMPGSVEVVVPALGKAPVKVEEPALTGSDDAADRPTDGTKRKQRRTLSYLVVGSGLAAITSSLIVGSIASSRWDEAKVNCDETSDGPLRCNQAGVDAAGSANTLGTLSTVTFVVGAAAVGFGTYLYITSRPSERAQLSIRPHLVPAIGPESAGLVLQGGF